MSQKKVKFTDIIVKESKVEDLRLILYQSELRNKSQNENADSLYQKAITFLTICITALSAVIIFVSSFENIKFNLINLLCFEVSVIVVIVIVKLKEILVMSNYYGMGAFPHSLIDEDYYTNLNDKEPEWYILQRLINDYQERVEVNEENNKTRAKILRDIVIVFYMLPG